MTCLFDAKPFIIAEVGSNHQGASDYGRRQCLESIARAKSCGADAVKFQAFTSEALYGPGHGALTHELPLEWLPQLREKADACGIELMVTAFSPELVAAVDPYVSVHKVASSDLSYPQLLQAVAKTGKPVLLSTGASSEGDIGLALRALGHAQDRTVLMYCSASYPSREHQLDKLRLLRERFGRPVGFSDHSQDVVWAPLSATRDNGAIVLEKHFTAFPDLDTPDRGHSLEPGDFAHMCDVVRLRRPATIGPDRGEQLMFLCHNRRLIATQDITTGVVLQYGVNFGAYRSLEDDDRGLSPFAWEQVQGKKAAREIKRGKGVGPGDFT